VRPTLRQRTACQKREQQRGRFWDVATNRNAGVEVGKDRQCSTIAAGGSARVGRKRIVLTRIGENDAQDRIDWINGAWNIHVVLLPLIQERFGTRNLNEERDVASEACDLTCRMFYKRGRPALAVNIAHQTANGKNDSGYTS
jgi:hypothetical protein